MPDAAPPNVLYIHSHDTGRHIEPYGHPVPTPDLQRLADQGSCSAGRSIGEQHVSEDPGVLGYDRVHDIESNHVATVAPPAVERLHTGLPGPFFLSGCRSPGAKATLYDRGLGVLLILRGAGGLWGGRVVDAPVSHLDLFPTACELAGVAPPGRLDGTSLLPLVRGEVERLHDQLYGGITYHAAYEPQRAIRTDRFKYIRRFGDHERPVLPNCDDGPAKDELIANGWADWELDREELYDLALDPNQLRNLIGEPRLAGVAKTCAPAWRAGWREAATRSPAGRCRCRRARGRTRPTSAPRASRPRSGWASRGRCRSWPPRASAPARP